LIGTNHGPTGFPSRELAWAGARNGRQLDVEAKNAKAFMTSWWALTKEAAARVNHKDAQLGAALAYYSIFSLGPFDGHRYCDRRPCIRAGKVPGRIASTGASALDPMRWKRV
jgi:hypothetical protein